MRLWQSFFCLCLDFLWIIITDRPWWPHIILIASLLLQLFECLGVGYTNCQVKHLHYFYHKLFSPKFSSSYISSVFLHLRNAASIMSWHGFMPSCKMKVGQALFLRSGLTLISANVAKKEDTQSNFLPERLSLQKPSNKCKMWRPRATKQAIALMMTLVKPDLGVDVRVLVRKVRASSS